jgi:hypothetical protein
MNSIFVVANKLICSVYLRCKGTENNRSNMQNMLIFMMTGKPADIDFIDNYPVGFAMP